MKVNLWLGDDEPETLNIPANEIGSFVSLLRNVDTIDFEGEVYVYLNEITFDAHSKAFDMAFSKKED
jgi:hypothetical protein